jgi:hypothetical protein
MDAEELRRLAEDPDTLKAVHLAIEDQLIDMRDSRMFMGYGGSLPANGLVVREADGSPSEIIRMGTRHAITAILRALADHVERAEGT